MLLAERRDPTQGALLRHWLQQAVVPAFAGRILAVDAAVALRSAALHVPDPKPFRDGLIAATALVHSLVVVTRNLADFEATGVPLLNPWQRGQRQRRAHPLPQQLKEHPHRVDLVQARELEHVFPDQVGGVLAAPPLRVVRALGSSWGPRSRCIRPYSRIEAISRDLSP